MIEVSKIIKINNKILNAIVLTAKVKPKNSFWSNLKKMILRGWTLTTTLSISTLLKNTLSKVSFSNLHTNDFLDHPKASEDLFLFLHF